MKGTIGFENLGIECIIGCLEKERKQPQMIVIDIRLELKFGKDHISDTVDYDQVASQVQKLAQQGQFYLLETLASVIAEQVLRQFTKIESVWVKVKKLKAIKAADFTFAECEMRR